MLATASMASFMNYLWLLGFVARPTDEIMQGRWWYAAIIGCIGAFVAFAPPMP